MYFTPLKKYLSHVSLHRLEGFVSGQTCDMGIGFFRHVIYQQVHFLEIPGQYSIPRTRPASGGCIIVLGCDKEFLKGFKDIAEMKLQVGAAGMVRFSKTKEFASTPTEQEKEDHKKDLENLHVQMYKLRYSK